MADAVAGDRVTASASATACSGSSGAARCPGRGEGRLAERPPRHRRVALVLGPERRVDRQAETLPLRVGRAVEPGGHLRLPDAPGDVGDVFQVV